MADHPSPFRLEAWHAGDVDDDAAAHVSGCPACRAYVDGLSAEGARFLARSEPADFVRRVRQRADAEEAPRFWGRLWWLAPLAGAAAAIGIWVAVPTDLTLQSPHGQPQPDTIRIKGGTVSLAAVVRSKSGAQSRHTGSVTLAQGECMRFEITVAAAMTVTVGLIQSDGTVAPLDADAALPPGTSARERTLCADGQASVDRVVAGAPDDVAAAVASQDWSQLAQLHVTSLAAP